MKLLPRGWQLTCAKDRPLVTVKKRAMAANDRNNTKYRIVDSVVPHYRGAFLTTSDEGMFQKAADQVA